MYGRGVFIKLNDSVVISDEIRSSLFSRGGVNDLATITGGNRGFGNLGLDDDDDAVDELL